MKINHSNGNILGTVTAINTNFISFGRIIRLMIATELMFAQKSLNGTFDFFDTKKIGSQLVFKRTIVTDKCRRIDTHVIMITLGAKQLFIIIKIPVEKFIARRLSGCRR